MKQTRMTEQDRAYGQLKGIGSMKSRTLLITAVLLIGSTSSCRNSAPLPTPSARPPSPQAVTLVSPTIGPTLVSPTLAYTRAPELAGYYMGTVVIASYYTLLEKQLHAAAYQLLGISEQNRYSLAEFEASQRNADTIAQVVTVQPVQAKRVQEQLPLFSEDTATEITFFVKVQLLARGNVPSSAPSAGFQTQYLVLTKEGEHWKIAASLSSVDMPTATLAAPAEMAPAFVYDVSYYDSIVAISRYYALFNHRFYEDAYDLESISMPQRGSLEDWVSYIQSLQIKETSIVDIFPEPESLRQLQIRPTPDPMNRRKFYARIYQEGAHGMAGPFMNGVHTYFITTLLENGGWKIYSVNTSP
jgi:hypothetical protein